MGDILFLAHRLPYPPDRGDRIRSYHLLKALAGMGRVHLVAFADEAAEVDGFEALRPLLGRIHVEYRKRPLVSAGLRALAGGRPISLDAFDSRSMRRAVTAMLAEEPIDMIFAFSGQMAQFVPSDTAARFVMDFVDVDSAKFEAYAGNAGGPTRWIHAREGRKLAAFERGTARRADVCLFVSEAEAALFRKRSGLGADRVVALENGIDLDFFRADADFVAQATGQGPLIVFTGQMDYWPNVDAVTGFATQIHPKLREAMPEARFAIVGRNPVAAVQRLGDLPGVTVTGAVADVRPWLAAADVAVAPLGIARGVQNKVLEAMAMARPVVASRAAFEGIDARPGRDLIVADGSDQADAILALLRDPEWAAAIGREARLRVEARYGWEARLAPLARLIGREPARRATAA